MGCRDAATEVRRVLILLRRRYWNLYQQGKLCNKCYTTVVNEIQRLELVLEEYEYEEALKRWGLRQ